MQDSDSDSKFVQQVVDGLTTAGWSEEQILLRAVPIAYAFAAGHSPEDVLDGLLNAPPAYSGSHPLDRLIYRQMRSFFIHRVESLGVRDVDGDWHGAVTEAFGLPGVDRGVVTLLSAFADLLDVFDRAGVK